jgi:hypothetical protein
MIAFQASMDIDILILLRLTYKGSEDDKGLELEVTGWVLNKR